MRARERGVALLIAMVILALGASIASAMLWNRGLAVHRSALIAAQRQAWQYDLGAEAWVEQILRRSADRNDTLNSAWAKHLPPLPVQGGVIQGGIEDLQGRFNLNDLVSNGKKDPSAFAVFQRLLVLLQIDPDIANAIVDWEDPDNNVTTPGGAESGYYASLDPSYAPANAPFVSVTTLRLVKGITPQIYNRLAPYITALPTATAININTASAPVLAAVVPDFSIEQARALIARRGTKGFPSIAYFQNKTQRKITFSLTLRSVYYRFEVTTTIGSTQLSLYSILYRNTQNQVRAIIRSFTPI